MRLYTATLTINEEIQPGVHLLEFSLPELARQARPGQFCMIRCCHVQARDPLLRRAFFLDVVETSTGRCRLLVYKRGRGSSWLAEQPVGSTLDILGPLGNGWTVRSGVRNLLLIGEEPLLAGLLSLLPQAIEQEISLTLVHLIEGFREGYPPALLPPEVEYRVLNKEGTEKAFNRELEDYFAWADMLACTVSRETFPLLQRQRRVAEKYLVQVALCEALFCGSGACFACQIRTRQGPRLVCREGPIFAWRDLDEN